MKNARYSVHYRRDREGRTDYKRRIKILASGKPRVIVRKTLRRMIIQIAETGEKGDKIISTTDSKTLEKYGWKHPANICTSYLTGLLAGKLIKEKIKGEIIPDLGKKPHKGGKIYAALKGMIDSGINIAHDPLVFPQQERINGSHIKKENFKTEMETTKNKIIQGK